MTATIDILLATARAELGVSEALLRDALFAQGRATEAIETAIRPGLKHDIEAFPKCSVPSTAHRAAHRPGRAPKSGSDPEEQAFIRARVNSLTFAQIAADVRIHFPA